MILIDTSIWIDHLGEDNPDVEALLDARRVLMHPFVIGEIAVGSLRRRGQVLASLQDLPPAEVVPDGEVFALIERERLYSLGIGYIDCHLLASVLYHDRARLWTRDRRLLGVAQRLGLAHPIDL